MIINRRRFEIARAKAQMSISELSKLAHCNARCFAGKGPVKVTVLAAGRIAKALNVELEFLLEEES